MNPSITIRFAKPADFVSIVALEQATEYAPHWAPATYAAILETPGADLKRCLLVAVKDESLVGFAVGVMHPAQVDGDASNGVHIAEVESVVVANATRRLGIGRALCRAVLAWACSEGATEIILEVRATSAAPIALYTSLGFRQAGRRPRYYRDPKDDALVMRLILECDQTASLSAPPSSPA
jgi:[ribosomal protein S18]-alanine N-acetyltransferase